MQTLTPEQFKKKYGTAGTEVFSQAKKPEVRTVGGDIKKQFTSGIDQVKEGYQQAQLGNNPAKAFQGATNLAMGGLQAATSFAAPLINSVAVPLGKATDYIGSKIGSNKKVQDFAQSKAGQITSDVAQTTGNLAGIAGTVAGIQEVPGQIKSGFETIKNVTNSTVDSAKSTLNTAKSAITGPTVDLETRAIQDATPAYTKKLVGEKAIKGVDGKSTPRVSEGGLIKGRTVNPTSLEVEAGRALAKVPNYPVEGTNLQKLQAIEPEIESQTTKLYSDLKNEGILRPPKEISSKVKKAIRAQANDSLVLQSSDPIVKKYVQLLDRVLKQNDGTLAGELRVRQAMDKAYRNARGRAAFGSDTASALDEIHGAGRDALNQDLIDNAKSTDVKAGLKSQWDLMRARDVLKTKAENEAGSAVGRFQQKNPITSKVIKGAGRAAGVGLGVDILH